MIISFLAVNFDWSQGMSFDSNQGNQTVVSFPFPAQKN